MPVSRQALSEREQRRAVGLFFVLCVAFIWVAASFLVQVSVSMQVQASLPIPFCTTSGASHTLLCHEAQAAYMPDAACSSGGALVFSFVPCMTASERYQ